MSLYRYTFNIASINRTLVGRELTNAICFNIPVPYAETLGVCSTNHVSEHFINTAFIYHECEKGADNGPTFVMELIQRLQREVVNL